MGIVLSSGDRFLLATNDGIQDRILINPSMYVRSTQNRKKSTKKHPESTWTKFDREIPYDQTDEQDREEPEKSHTNPIVNFIINICRLIYSYPTSYLTKSTTVH
jgi:hypothetical protein